MKDALYKIITDYLAEKSNRGESLTPADLDHVANILHFAQVMDGSWPATS